MELVKILVKLILKPTSTGFVGEFANFCVGCSLALLAGFIYRLNKTKKGAVIGMAAGTVIMTIVAVILNAVVMLPFYSHFMPLDTIIAAGAAINPAISNVWTFVILAVGPFNILKGVIVSLLTALVYKRVSVIIHSDSERRAVKTSLRIGSRRRMGGFWLNPGVFRVRGRTDYRQVVTVHGCLNHLYGLAEYQGEKWETSDNTARVMDSCQRLSI